MKKVTAFTFFILINLNLFSQDSLQMSVLFHWDADTIHSYKNWGNMAQQYNEIWGYYDSLKNREYAIIGSAEGIYIWDITNTDSVILSDYELGADTADVHRDFKTYKNYLYAVADEGFSSLQIFDLSYLPDSVHKVYDSQEFVIRSHNCYIDNGRLYLCTPNFFGGVVSLRMLDLSNNPEKPSLLADFNLKSGQGTHIHDLFVRDNIAYCSNGFDGLFIFDVSDPNDVTTLASITNYTDKNYNHSSWLSEDSKTLFFSDEKHGMRIKAWDISNFNNMQEISVFQSNPGAMAHNSFVKGHKLYVSYFHDGVWVFDISDPRNPETIAYYDTYMEPDGYDSFQGCWGVYPFLPSGNIIASDFSNGLFVLSDNSIAKDPPINSISEKIIPFPKLIPNIVKHKTTLTIPNVIKSPKIELFDVMGKKVYQKIITSTAIQFLDFSFLSLGNYFLVLKGDNYEQTIKFVKK